MKLIPGNQRIKAVYEAPDGTVYTLREDGSAEVQTVDQREPRELIPAGDLGYIDDSEDWVQEIREQRATIKRK